MRILKSDHEHREMGLHKISSLLAVIVITCCNLYETVKTVKLTLLLLKHNIDLFWKTQSYN
uniref:Uncharacterized protein n=1 Tax=Brassica oleracea TaxID=3712 RepID=A0A3P6E2R2_BRAOL|nr:unnamed protein product [Brassica oleracea]